MAAIDVATFELEISIVDIDRRVGAVVRWRRAFLERAQMTRAETEAKARRQRVGSRETSTSIVERGRQVVWNAVTTSDRLIQTTSEVVRRN